MICGRMPDFVHPQPSPPPDFVHPPDFVDGGNLPRALRAAYSVIRALGRGEIDWALRREEIELALEVLCDAVGGSPTLAYRTVMLVQPDLRQPERWEDEGQISRAVRRACDLTVMAEVAHRCERYRQAVVWSEVAIRGLAEAVSNSGDQKALLKTVSSSKPNLVAGAAGAIAGIWPAAVRRATYPPQVKEHHYQRLDPLFSALLASGQTYSRSHAFGCQGLFLEAERLRSAQDPEDWRFSRIADLHEISKKTRGDSKRPQATAPLVEMERLRVIGDIEGAAVQAALARERLIGFGLPRHLERMAKHGYLSFDAA
jgi:hypothetical protein